MHCFSCDALLSNPVEDKPTGRYYCERCLWWTTEEQLRLSGKDVTTFWVEKSDPEEETVTVPENRENDDDYPFRD